jgi:hypothetical protein
MNNSEVREVLAPTVEINLDKLRHLTINLNVLAEIEERTGKPMAQLRDFGLMNVKLLRTMLTASLREEDPSLTETMVGKMVGPHNMVYVSNRLNEAWKLNVETPEEKKAEGGPDPLKPSEEAAASRLD